MVFFSATTSAADIEAILVAPSEPVAHGKPVTIEVYFMNPTDDTVQTEADRRMECRLVSGKRISKTELTPITRESYSRMILPAKGFLKKRYSFIVPKSIKGNVEIELIQFASKPVLLCVQAKDSQAEKDVAEIPACNDTLEEIQTLFQTKFPYLPAYEPTYFGVGTDPEKSKFQLSFKYRIFSAQYGWAKKNPWLTGFHFGYTQTSLWDLQSESKPFEDTSYKPEIFYLSRNLTSDIPWLKFFCLQAGLQHESNGRGGIESRSTNYVYAKPIFAFNIIRGYHLKVSPKVWLYLGNDNETNADLEDYRGYFDLEFKFGKQNSLVLGSNLRYGCKGGSMQLDATYPVYKMLFLDDEQGWLNPNLYFHVQYFNGYAESLIRFNEKSHAIRLGIAFVR